VLSRHSSALSLEPCAGPYLSLSVFEIGLILWPVSILLVVFSLSLE
jgi:hypothetical protein